MQDRLFIAAQIMMRLRGWFPLRLVDQLFDAGYFAIIGISQKNNFVIRIGCEHLRDGAELGRKIGVS